MRKKILSSLFLLILLLAASQSVFAASTKYVFQLSRGAERSFKEVNPGDRVESSVDLRLVDLVKSEFEISFSSMSGNALALEGSGSILDMSTWIEFPEGKKVLFDPEEGLTAATIPFVITLPENISPGDYRGMMQAKLGASDIDGAGGAGVKFTTAIGIPFTFSIDGVIMNVYDK